MTRFQRTPGRTMPALLPLLVAGVLILLLKSVFAAAPSASPTAAIAGPTRKIVGYAVDPTGRPIADALVLLTRADDFSLSPPQPTVVAQSQTQSSGRFELSVSAADLKTPAVGWPVFAIWVHKAGFAVAHTTVAPEHCERPYAVAMEGDTPVSFRVERPDGSPCATADVTPLVVDLQNQNHYDRLPEPIKERLKTRTTANGRYEVPGFNNRKLTLAIEADDFGMQTLFVSGRQTPFATVRLRPTHRVEGRLILPAGLKADLSRGRITLTMRDERSRSVSAALGKDLRWCDGFTLQPGTDGDYWGEVPDGVEIAQLCPTYDLPFVVDARAGFLGSGMTGGGTTRHPQGWQRSVRVGISFDSSLAEVLVQLTNSLLSPENIQNEEIWLRRGVRVTRVVRDAQTMRPLPGVVVRMTKVPQHPEFKTSFAQVGKLSPIVGLPLTVVIAAGDCALASSIAIASQRMEQFADLCTDEHGRIKCCLCPGQTYVTTYGVPEHYRPARSDRRLIEEIPTGAAACGLPPIELVPECQLRGHCEDETGRPATGVRIRATVAASEHQSELGPRWTRSDASGDFHFDGLEPGTSVTLVTVRAGVPLDERAIVVGDKGFTGAQVFHEGDSIRLTHIFHEKGRSLASLAGRVVGPDHKPISGAEVVVEVEHSPDPTHFFRATADAAGRVQTPAQYPQGLKYRLAVRSMLKSVAVSPWICPQTSGSQFADVAVEPARLGLDKRIDGGEVLALIDGRPLLASEIFERAFPESLTQDGLSLRVVADEIKRGRATERKYRELQNLAIKKYASEYVRFHMLSQALEAKFDAAEKADVERRIDTAFEGYLDTLERQLKVVGREQLKEKLCSLSTSIATFKKDFRYRVLADEYIRQAGAAAESRIDGSRLLADYESHLASYALPARVGWQMLEFQFGFAPTHSPPGEQASQDKTGDYFATADKPQSTDASAGPTKTQSAGGEIPSEPSFVESRITDEAAKKLGAGVDVANFAEPWSPQFTRAQARLKCEAALAELQRGTSFEQVAKVFTTGANAEGGGWQPAIRPESVADPKTAEALRQLPEGSTSGVIETEYAYRIVKVGCRMPAAWRSFDEVAPAIRRQIGEEAKQKALEDLYQRTTIESPCGRDLVDHETATLPPRSESTDAFSE